MEVYLEHVTVNIWCMFRNRRRKRKDITLSKTRELGSTIESEQLSEGLTEEEVRVLVSSRFVTVDSRFVSRQLSFC